ncbi:WD-40 repeat-containing protein [Calothrix sp. NIES-4071]|nr:WD-40 repeat-containing protein [Calothrix sp. NIES-4071]BAZ62990.1 WD-40 repeat-containing protein [Calothrix sp. NIES-4105]
MTEWQFTATIANANHRSLQRLIRAIALSKGQFALILIRCNYGQLRTSVVENLRTLTKDIYLRELELSRETTTNLHNTIISDLYLDIPAVAGDALPEALMVFGLESVIKIDDLLIGLNQGRDIYSDTFPFPLVLWLKDEVATQLSRLAPDFKSWAATTIKFEMTKEDLIALIRKDTESLFNHILTDAHAPGTIAASLPGNSKEIETAREDLLRIYNTQLEPELNRYLEFVLGHNAYINDQVEEALSHYQRSLTVWEDEKLTKNSLYKAVVLFHLGLCYGRMADLRPALSRSYWLEGIVWFKKSLELFESIGRQDKVAKFISELLQMLQRIEAWDELEAFASKSLELHAKYSVHAVSPEENKAHEAQAYGFLAVVASSRSNWLQAYELADTARSIAEVAPGISRAQESWYLLLLGRAQRHLGEWEEAVNNLEWAKVVCEVQYEPSLYLEIVEELRSLYFFERHNYSEAFNLKQEKIQVEHQYGFRAFIGASTLQPQRYKVNELAYKTLTRSNNQSKISYIPEEVAQEIAASGREKDINRLIGRLGRTDCKLTIIHGPSGVGKSSLIRAGLVPTLAEKPIGERIAKPIVLSVYSDWITVLGRNINQALFSTELSVLTKFTTSILLGKLRELAERNYTVVLIFDQLEEFFFAVKEQSQRILFYKFVSQCLNVAFIKIIFSLREDYLHYLLEFERLCNENNRNTYDLGVINKNILDKDIRYYLGNFSVQDAIGVIDVLTSRAHYELSNDLINQLVQDLATEVEQVHPIELQIVGAQLQAEKIKTLDEYKESGGSSKLVERWLTEVIKDCGRENEQLTWKLLFELTDEKGTRPLRTKIELAVALTKSAETSFYLDSDWELILNILVGSGLVVVLREESSERYQLVHDYLVEPIRQKNNYGIVAELEKVRFEKTRAEVAQKLSQEQLTLVLHRRLREARAAGVALLCCTASIGGLWWQADLQKRAAQGASERAERSEDNLRVSAITAASEALFASSKEFDALIESLRAWRGLQQSSGVKADTKARVVTALQQAVYGVKEINRLEGHTDVLWGVTYSPDGKLIASGGTDRMIKIWRPDGTLLQTLNGHELAVTSIAFSPDGKTLASASLDKKVLLWRMKETGEFESSPYKSLIRHSEGIYSVNFSPDGRLIATGSADNTIKIWRSSGELVKIIRGHTGEINWVTFSPDGQLIASASQDKTVKIWRRDGSLVTTLPLNDFQGVTSVVFSPDNRYLAAGNRSGAVQLFRQTSIGAVKTSNFQLIKTLSNHTATVWNLNFSPNSKYLASAGDDNAINIWNLDGNLIETFKGHNDAVSSIAFSPDGKTLASASWDKSIKLWSLAETKLPVLSGHEAGVASVAWSPNGKMLASASRDHTVMLWQYDKKNGVFTTSPYKTLVGHSDLVQSVSFDPTGQFLATGSHDKTIKIWNLDGSLVRTLTGHLDKVRSVAWSPDGSLIASSSQDKTIKLWDRDGQNVKTLSGHNAWVNNVAWSPDGQILASASDDKTVKLWKRDGTLSKTLISHDSWVLGTSFSPTDKILASAGWDNTVRLWDWNGKLLQTLLRGYSDSVNSVTFSPNGEVLAAAGWDSKVKLWSREGKLIKTFNGHNAPVLSVAWSPDGQTLASASEDKTIILWNLDLNDLLKRGCNWVGDYLKHNRNVDGRDRNLCEGIN